MYRSDTGSAEKAGEEAPYSNSSSQVTDSDSDFEVEDSMPSLESFLGKDILRKMKPKEKKLQEVINGKSVCLFVCSLCFVAFKGYMH